MWENLCYSLEECRPGDWGLECTKHGPFIAERMVLSTVYLTSKGMEEREVSKLPVLVSGFFKNGFTTNKQTSK